MSFLATTRTMFSFVVLLYLFGFAIMMSRWMSVEQQVLEDDCEPLRERRGALEYISLLNINAQDLPTVPQQDESLLKIDHDLPILNKDVANESKESFQESNVKVPAPKTRKKSAAPVQKTGKKPLKGKTVLKTKANKGSLPAQKAVVNDNAEKSAIVAKKHTKEILNPQKGNDPQKKVDQISEVEANKDALPKQKAVVNDNAEKSAIVAKKHTKEILNPQKGNDPQKKVGQISEVKATKDALPKQKAVVNDNAEKSAIVAKKHTKEILNPQKGNDPQKKVDQISEVEANKGSLPKQKAVVNDNAKKISEAKVATKGKNVPVAKTKNANVAPIKPVPGKPKEGPAKPAKNPKQLQRGKKDLKSLWQNEQAKRRATLRQACDRLGLGNQTIQQKIKLSKRSFWPFIVEDRYRLLYTYISKVGSTNWKSAFLVLQGKYKNVEDVPGKFAHARSLVKLSSLPDDEIQKRLNDYTNFIFVRHPFARVLSAYRSKFLQPNKSFQSHTGVRIIKMYRKNATKMALQTGSDVTFHEFVQYIVNSKVINFDGPWQPIYKMVLPCMVRFDFIGKLETGEEDAKFILEETKVDHLVHFMATKRNVSHDDSIFNRFYSQIPSNDLVKLYKVYEPDFTLFGYEVPQSIKSLIQVGG